VVALPFRGNRVVEGWQVSGILNLTSGAPFTPTVIDQSGLGTGGQRPNLAAGRNLDGVVTGIVNQWFDPTAFTLPAPGTLGTVGRKQPDGPQIHDRRPRVPEKTSCFNGPRRFSSAPSCFNVTNHVNFGQPSTNVFAQTINGGGSVSPTAGRITTANTSRQIQFALKLLF